MKVYLVILNWVLASALVSCALWLAPIVGGWPLPVGMFIGCMMTAGMVSWQYYKDQSPEKEWKWRKNYFKKDYRIEIIAQVAITAILYGLSCLFWQGFFLLLAGFFAAWILNILVEWFWAAIHPHYLR